MYMNEDSIKVLIEDLAKSEFKARSHACKDTSREADEAVLSENDGYIEVRGQQLFVIDPKKDGKYPVIVPNSTIQVMVNGHLIKSDTAVTSKDEIKVYKELKEDPYEIIISEDELSIYLHVSSELFKKYCLKDQKRSNRLMLEMEAESINCNLEEISVQVMEDILKKGIKVEIDSTAIMQELLNPTFEPIKVAEGLPPIPSVDSVLEKYFSTDLKEIIEEVDGKVDYKNRLKIPYAMPGQVIAMLYPAKEGEDGYNVFGNVLVPNPPKTIEIRPKPRIRVIDNGEVIALKQGRPTITGSNYVKYIDILETYEINRDVDMETGNIFFHDDILIRGHIKDGMRVESTGSIYVLGNVYKAELIASQDIHIIGTVVNSKIVAGQLSMFYSQVYKKVQDLAVSFKKMRQAMDQLKNTILSKGQVFHFNTTFFMLFEMKFKRVIDDVKELNDIFNEMPSRDIAVTFRILMNSLANFQNFHSLHKIQSMDELISVQFSIEELIKEMDSMTKEDSNIHIKSASSSILKTNGEIVIKKDGVLQSELFAGTNIIFEKKDACIRGGKLEALKIIKAGVIGTEMGQAPDLYAGECLQAEKIYQANVKMPYFIKYIDENFGRLKMVYDPELGRVV